MGPDTPAAAGEPIQRVVKVRRDYNTWVANQTVEDYALRFTPRRFRKWSVFRVANTAFGGSASFLVLEAVGATMMVTYGFINAFWAILAAGLIIFLTGLPICLYASRYGVDMDLLTRGAGFGYIGSTITSLIYASFTFIFFALEAAIMAYALELYFGLPPSIGYFICAVGIIPLVTFGISSISRLQALTQPLWLALMALPYVFVLLHDPGAVEGLPGYGGRLGKPGEFDLLLCGAALTIGLALITQIGEQADYLRFMPECTARNRGRWLLGVTLGGSGWVVLGVVKMLGGALLAYLAIGNAVPLAKAVDPNQMYLVGFGQVFASPAAVLAVTALFVVVSQLKINVTNAYAGSLAWSNFFARLTHSHPGRIVWMVFNTAIALVLMELDLFHAMEDVLGLYSNVAISWMGAVLADLVINKPLGLSPKGIEFKRAHLYDINPVGVGAMLIASAVSVAAFLGVFGATAQAFSALLAMGTAMIVAPLIAWQTGGRYYLSRPPSPLADTGALRRCCICDKDYEADDMAYCPAYQEHICSLCCSLDARCNDLCKPHARLASQWSAAVRRVMPARLIPYLQSGLGHYLLVMVGLVPALALLLKLLHDYVRRTLDSPAGPLDAALGTAFVNVFAVLLVVGGTAAWWLVLTGRSRRVAQEESNRQTHLLMEEIERHKETDAKLQAAKQAADQANRAKSRYITAISHELRTPLNSILGYAQILDADESIPANRRQAVRVIRRSGDHLLSVIERTLDIARIEAGKLTLEVRAIDFRAFIGQIVRMFEVQARSKGIGFSFEALGSVPPVVRADERRLRQILLNILGNAVKFTASGTVTFRLRYALEIALFEISDTGPGIAESELQRVFEPFTRGDAANAGPTGGTGLGLTISSMLTGLMGGELTVDSRPGQGSTFRVRLFLPQVHGSHSVAELPVTNRIGYIGERRRILVVDNERDDREMLASILAPLGFVVEQAASGVECLSHIPRFDPHLILMDLAMPGLDGWETLRMIREQRLGTARIAIVSANAFDKGASIGEAAGHVDFLVKPVRVSELLDMVERALEIEWLQAPVLAAPAPAIHLPADARQIAVLAELVELGYVRGILDKLDELQAGDAALRGFADSMRELAARFQFDEMAALLRTHEHATH